MEQITLRLAVRTLAEIEREARELHRTRSEHIRDTLESRDEHEADTDKLREQIETLEGEKKRLSDRVDELETELERVKNEKRLMLEDRDEKQELVKYVEDERTAERRWREAGLTKRLRWKLFGMDSNDD